MKLYEINEYNSFDYVFTRKDVGDCGKFRWNNNRNVQISTKVQKDSTYVMIGFQVFMYFWIKWLSEEISFEFLPEFY